MMSGHSEFLATDVDFDEQLRRALRASPVNVSILTALETDGKYTGLAVTCAVPFSASLPSMIVAINHSASSFPFIFESRKFCLNQITTADLELLERFGRSDQRASRFAGGDWRPGLWRLPFLASANTCFFCAVKGAHDYGDHTVFIASIEGVRIGGETQGRSDPLIWINGGPARLASVTRL